MIFVFTGVVHAADGNRITRDRLATIVGRLGHTMLSKVRLGTTYLVVGENVRARNTEKMRLAESLGVPTLREDSFVELMTRHATELEDEEALECLRIGTPRVGSYAERRGEPRWPVINERFGDDVATVSAPTHPDPKQSDPEPEKVTVFHKKRRKIRVRQHTKVDYT